MTRTLEALGFAWDGPIVLQSQRQAAYLDALEQLRAAGRIYPCGCSRRQLQEQLPDPEQEGGYPGTCRNGPSGPPPWAWRFRVRDETTQRIEDGLQGPLQWSMQTIGDAVIQRRDGVIAYQLAVVADDAEAGVSDVVRGADLLPSTAWQLELQSALSLPKPRYLHLPLVVAADGKKLSKSAAAIPLDPGQAAFWLHRGLTLLQQAPPADLRRAEPREIWQWAREHWDVTRLRGIRSVREDGSGVDAY
jgi:glutamyl-Q tRNA(Asp) synthetase